MPKKVIERRSVNTDLTDYRSMEKDFQLAAFADVSEKEWRNFFCNPLPKPQEPAWPIDFLDDFQPVTSESTLTDKERQIIAKYREKRQIHKVVWTYKLIPCVVYHLN